MKSKIICPLVFAVLVLALVSAPAFCSVEKGDEYAAKGDYKKAIDEYEAAYKNAPEDPGPLLKLARAADSDKWFGRSYQYWEEYLAKFPNGGAVEEAEKKAAFARRWVGSFLFDTGQKLDVVIPYFEKAAELDPGMIEAWYWLARAQMQKGDCDSASKALKKAVYIDEKNEEAQWLLKVANGCAASGGPAYDYYDKGYALFEKKDFKGALEMYSKAVVENPNFADAHYWIARIHFDQGEFELALPEWKAVLAIKPSDKQAAWFLEETNRNLKKKPAAPANKKGNY